MTTPTIRLTIKPAPIIRGTVRGIGLPGPPGDDASATTDAGALISGTLDDNRLSGNVVLNADMQSAATKATPVDADGVILIDSAASNAIKRTLWSGIKATLKTYFDTLYPRPSQTGNAGKFLTTDGTNESWAAGGSQYVVVRDVEGATTFYSTYVGPNAGNITGTGVQNTAVGKFSLQNLTTGYNNTSIGALSSPDLTTGFWNTAAGLRSLRFTTSGTHNTGVGAEALYGLTSGVQNTGLGVDTAAGLTVGELNTAVGYYAMKSCGTAPYYNAVLGALALQNVTGSFNSVVGLAAAEKQTSANWTATCGVYAAQYNETGDGNTAIGARALRGVSGNSNSDNVAVGRDAGMTVTTGSRNVFIGNNCADNVTTGSDNIIIGAGIDLNAATDSNVISIGNLIFGTSTASGTTIASGNVGIGVRSPAVKLEVAGAIAATATVSAWSGAAYLFGNGISAGLNTNANESLLINFSGYNFGLTQFRDTGIYDGKGSAILSIVGSTKAATFTGSLKLGIKTIATLPSAASSTGERYQVSDSATIVNRVAFSNGSAWYYEGTAAAV